MKKLRIELKYELGRDLFLAPYDWRLAGDAHAKPSHGVGGFYPQLQSLIEKAVLANGRKAVLVSHSLGCPTLLSFFHQYVSEEWRSTHIETWVALSGPWVGGASQMEAYLGGNTLGLPTWIVPHDYVKPVQVNATSGVWLSPSPLAFGTEVLVKTPSRNYTASDLPALISKIGAAAGGDQALSLQQKLGKDLPSMQSQPRNVAMKIWYSTGVRTMEQFEYSEDISAGFNMAPSKIVSGDGDGTVNLISLKYPEKHWPKTNDAVEYRVFPNASHFDMLSDDRVLEALTTFLKSLSDSSAEDLPIVV